MVKLNDFKCNLHALVNLVSQAESELKIWEHAALKRSTACTDIEQSTAQFIRAVAKLCVHTQS